MNQGHLLKNRSSLIILFLLPVPSWKEGGRNLRYSGSIGNVVCCGQILEVSGKSLKELEQIRRMKLNNLCLEDNWVNKACKLYYFERKKQVNQLYFLIYFLCRMYLKV